MSRYRAYVLDENNHIVGLHDFDADTETAALDYAGRYAFGHEVEVWQGFRRVGLLRHKKSAALSAPPPEQTPTTWRRTERNR